MRLLVFFCVLGWLAVSAEGQKCNAYSCTAGILRANANLISCNADAVCCDEETPTMTLTPIPTKTASVTLTGTRTDTLTPTTTRTRTRSSTSTPTSTRTRSRSATATDTATETTIPTRTSTPTATPVPTRTITPSSTSTPTGTLTPSRTPTSTSTRSETDTDTPSPTETRTDSETPTSTRTRTASLSGTLSPTGTETDSRTNTLTVIPTRTSSPTKTRTRTGTATPTETDTRSETITSTRSRSATRSETATDTATHRPPTRTATPTTTRTSTRSNTLTVIPTRTSTATFTRSPTTTETRTPTPTRSSTATLTLSPSPTRSRTRTPSLTSTDTRSETDTRSNTLTVIPTKTSTATLTPSRSPTSSPTSTRTRSPTRTTTETGSDTRTNTLTVIPTLTSTPSSTSTRTRSSTPTRTPTATGTLTVIPTKTASSTSTGTDTIPLKTCATYKCQNTAHLLPNPSTILQRTVCTDRTCCAGIKLCYYYTCPSAYVRKSNYATIACTGHYCTRDQCCDLGGAANCSSFSGCASLGLSLPASPAQTPCSSTTTCTVYDCCSGVAPSYCDSYYSWGECSRSCGGGTTSGTMSANNINTNCPKASTKVCNTQACVVVVPTTSPITSSSLGDGSVPTNYTFASTANISTIGTFTATNGNLIFTGGANISPTTTTISLTSMGLENNNNGLFTLLGNLTISGTSSIFINRGNLTLVPAVSALFSVPLDNQNTVSVGANSVLTLSGGGSSYGPIYLAANSVLQLTSSFTLTTVGGAGIIRIFCGVTVFFSSMYVTVDVIADGSTSLPSGSACTPSVLRGSGTFANSLTLIVANLEINMANIKHVGVLGDLVLGNNANLVFQNVKSGAASMLKVLGKFSPVSSNYTVSVSLLDFAIPTSGLEIPLASFASATSSVLPISFITNLNPILLGTQYPTLALRQNTLSLVFSALITNCSGFTGCSPMGLTLGAQNMCVTQTCTVYDCCSGQAPASCDPYYGGWGECSRSCGGGTMSRSMLSNNPNTSCPKISTRSCNTQQCVVIISTDTPISSSTFGDSSTPTNYTFNGTATLNATGSFNVTNGNLIFPSGATILPTTTSINVASSGIENSGVFTMQGNLVVQGTSSTFTNRGNVSLAVAIAALFSVPFDNQNTVSVGNSSTLTLSGGGTSSGSIVLAANSVLQITASFTLTTVTGSGTIRIIRGVILLFVNAYITVNVNVDGSATSSRKFLPLAASTDTILRGSGTIANTLTLAWAKLEINMITAQNVTILGDLVLGSNAQVMFLNVLATAPSSLKVLGKFTAPSTSNYSIFISVGPGFSIPTAGIEIPLMTYSLLSASTVPPATVYINTTFTSQIPTLVIRQTAMVLVFPAAPTTSMLPTATSSSSVDLVLIVVPTVILGTCGLVTIAVFIFAFVKKMLCFSSRNVIYNNQPEPAKVEVRGSP